MPRSISRVGLRCGLLALVAVAGGCQRGQTWKLAPVEGTVTKDGRPLAGLRVIFWADVEAGTQGPRTSGVTDAAGHYELRTDVGDQGAAIGRYRVSLLVPSRRGRIVIVMARRPSDGTGVPVDELPRFRACWEQIPEQVMEVIESVVEPSTGSS